MQRKKQVIFKTPDTTKMQEVVINHNTKIYIPVGADPEEARIRYLERQESRGKSNISSRKPALT
jgi:hypothetical protein